MWKTCSPRKGIGSGFTATTEALCALKAEQDEEALTVLLKFQADYFVVDGDPWNDGFQRHIKAVADSMRQSDKPLPTLIWAKNVPMSKASPESEVVIDPEEKQKRLQQARKWAASCGLTILVLWFDYSWIDAKIDEIFGTGTAALIKEKPATARGLLHLSESTLSWVQQLSDELKAAVQSIEDSSRQKLQYFEKCSFEYSAKGNLIFDLLESPLLAAHGVVTIGGGESVLLELASKYLAPGFDPKLVAVLPHTRERSQDPKLPRHLGSAFGGAAEPTDGCVVI